MRSKASTPRNGARATAVIASGGTRFSNRKAWMESASCASIGTVLGGGGSGRVCKARPTRIFASGGGVVVGGGVGAAGFCPPRGMWVGVVGGGGIGPGWVAAVKGRGE